MSWNEHWSLTGARGQVLPKILNDLKAALTERLAVLEISLHTDIVDIAEGEIPKPSWFTAFQNHITNIIPSFVDHTYQGGGPVGRYDGDLGASYWNEAGILSEIGEMRYDVPSDIYLIQNWAHQQYKILNLLRWTAYSGGFSASFAQVYDIRFSDPPSDHWDDPYTPSIVYNEGEGGTGGVAMIPYWEAGTGFGGGGVGDYEEVYEFVISNQGVTYPDYASRLDKHWGDAGGIMDMHVWPPNSGPGDTADMYVVPASQTRDGQFLIESPADQTFLSSDGFMEGVFNYVGEGSWDAGAGRIVLPSPGIFEGYQDPPQDPPNGEWTGHACTLICKAIIKHGFSYLD